jgi:hypothetical protein
LLFSRTLLTTTGSQIGSGIGGGIFLTIMGGIMNVFQVPWMWVYARWVQWICVPCSGWEGSSFFLFQPPLPPPLSHPPPQDVAPPSPTRPSL